VSTLWTAVFWLVAGVASTLYSVFAFRIHGVPLPEHVSARRHQHWFNFAGSLTGWFALWVLAPWNCLAAPCSAGSMTWGHFGLGVVAFLGITGYLPLAAFSAAVKVLESLKGDPK
jgi:hypothetical protein